MDNNKFNASEKISTVAHNDTLICRLENAILCWLYWASPQTITSSLQSLRFMKLYITYLFQIYIFKCVYNHTVGDGGVGCARSHRLCPKSLLIHFTLL